MFSLIQNKLNRTLSLTPFPVIFERFKYAKKTSQKIKFQNGFRLQIKSI
jgi:hypothetical protein